MKPTPAVEALAEILREELEITIESSIKMAYKIVELCKKKGVNLEEYFGK